MLILQGQLHPREHLGQEQLAQRLGISKVPVREALKQLYAEGLVGHDHNRGYFVAPVDRDDADQLYRLRRWIEAELLRTARWPEPGELAELRRQVDSLAQAAAAGQQRRWRETLAALRLAIFNLSPSKTLLREATRLWQLTDRYRVLLLIRDGPLCEQAIVEALATRDRERLLSTYHEIRDRIESLLREALARLPHGHDGDA
jgi:DNA-binding GntR family transcriptional regulator